MAVARPDPFLAAAALQKGTARPGIRGGQQLPGQRITVGIVRRRLSGGRNQFL
jgi:hypothetical protein